MKWSKVIDSLDRHWNDFKLGHDTDYESLLNTLGHVGANLQFLIDYVHYYPEGDDRRVSKLQQRKFALDIDETVLDFCGGWMNKYNCERPTAWSFDRLILNRLDEVNNDTDFWMNLDPIFQASDLPGEPTAYISHRSCDVSLSEDWLDKHGFPVAPVIHVKNTSEKVGICKEMGIELFLEDNYKTFKEFRREGLLCYLFSRKHNERYNVGHFRINNIKDLPIYKYVQ